MTENVATAKIYLGSSFYNDDHRTRALTAKKLLAKNPTVLRVHFPFDKNFIDSEEVNPKVGDVRSMTWRLGTYQNDLSGIVNATCGVFLYDMDKLDDGCAFEIGFMRALHKPVILVPFTQKEKPEKVMNLMIAQGVTTIIDGNTELQKLVDYDFNTTPAIPVVDYKII